MDLMSSRKKLSISLNLFFHDDINIKQIYYKIKIKLLLN